MSLTVDGEVERYSNKQGEKNGFDDVVQCSRRPSRWRPCAWRIRRSARRVHAVLARLQGWREAGAEEAGNNKANPNCVGENVSPALNWGNPPEGTKSYALMMFDPEGRPPGGVSHWVAYGIPASVTGFAEGEVSKPATNMSAAPARMKLSIYSGPCTPAGPPHHYTFTLIATDLEPTALAPGMTREELVKALEGHAKVATGLIGMFSKP